MTVSQVQKGRTHYAPELRSLSPQATGAIIRLRNAAYSQGVLPRKVKLLAALAISATIRCEPCLEYYAKEAFEDGVTLQERVEMLNVAIAMQGCPGEVWADKALKAFEGYAGNCSPQEEIQDENQPDSCCQ